jgi:hypothetical protein
MTQHAGDVQ